MFDEKQANLTHLGYLLAEASRTVVFLVGAGVSKPAGIPLWPTLQGELKKIALDFVAKSNAQGKNRTLREIKETVDPWYLGDVLEKAIPQEVYDREVRKILTSSHPCSTYKQLWDLNPSGMISLNLDSLAKDALNGADDQYATSVEESRYERFSDH